MGLTVFKTVNRPEDCVVYGEVAVAVGSISVSSSIKQNSDEVAMTFQCRDMEWQFAVNALAHLHQSNHCRLTTIYIYDHSEAIIQYMVHYILYMRYIIHTNTHTTI